LERVSAPQQTGANRPGAGARVPLDIVFIRRTVFCERYLKQTPITMLSYLVDLYPDQFDESPVLLIVRLESLLELLGRQKPRIKGLVAQGLRDIGAIQ